MTEQTHSALPLLFSFNNNISPPSTSTPILAYLGEAIMLLKLYYYYALHIITSAFFSVLPPQIQYKTVTISIYAVSIHASLLFLFPKWCRSLV